MSESALSEQARLLAELAELVVRTSETPDTHRLLARARALVGRLHPDDPARWALGQQTVTVELDVPARVVAETLVNEGTGAALVCSSNGPVGIVAERDLVAAIASNRDLEKLQAGDLVSSELVTAGPRDSIAHVAALMVRHRVRHVPLVDGEGATTRCDRARRAAASSSVVATDVDDPATPPSGLAQCNVGSTARRCGTNSPAALVSPLIHVTVTGVPRSASIVNAG